MAGTLRCHNETLYTQIGGEAAFCLILSFRLQADPKDSTVGLYWLGGSKKGSMRKGKGFPSCHCQPGFPLPTLHQPFVMRV